MSFMRLAILGLSACTLLAACPQPAEPTIFTGSATGQSGGAGGSGGLVASVSSGFVASVSSGAGGGDDPVDPGWNPPGTGSSEPCNDLTQYIYVISGNLGPFPPHDHRLYSFWPSSLTFQLVGDLKCPAEAGSPVSMAIDQHGTAWVLYMFGEIYQVDLATGQCNKTPFVPPDPQHIRWTTFGMAFISNGPVPAGESLYVREGMFYDPGDDPFTRRLGRFDTTAFTITTLGEGAGANSDLTGTADGRLFALVKQAGPYAVLTELDKTNGSALTETPLAGIIIEDSWALAAWGGAVWLFTSTYDSTSHVDRFDPTTGMTTPMLKDVGFEIVGAGVSACAPLTTPN